MKELLIQLLETFKYPVYLQGSLGSSTEYDDSFFTFWNNDTYDDGHYDDDPFSYVWDFDVNFYSNDAEKVNTVLLQAIKLLKQNGFIVSGVGHDVGSDCPTHTGRGVSVLYVEYKKEENANV